MLIYLLSVGLTLIFGIMRVINLAHGALYSLGAYLGVWVAHMSGSFGLALLIAPLFVAMVGGLLHLCAVGPLAVRGRDELEIALLTFGLMFIAIGAFELIFGKDYMSIALPDWLSGSVSLFGIAYPLYRLFIIAVGLLIAGGLWLLLDKTIIGAAVRACVDNRDMAVGIGMDIRLVLGMVFALGAGLAGLAGVIAAPVLSVSPHMGGPILLMALIVVVIGGMGSIGGSFYGSLTVGILDTLTRSYFPQLSMFAIYIMLALILVMRPQGLFGRQVSKG